jgi:hypothetical protein
VPFFKNPFEIDSRFCKLTGPILDREFNAGRNLNINENQVEFGKKEILRAQFLHSYRNENNYFTACRAAVGEFGDASKECSQRQPRPSRWEKSDLQ